MDSFDNITLVKKNAPDKLFITAQWRPKEKKDEYYASATKTTHPREEEYIRKDSLLKWINEARVIPHENTIARDLAFQEVVNKLNSM